MKAWVLDRLSDLSVDDAPLKLVDAVTPQTKPNDILIHVSCCGICHTELDEIEGRTPPRSYPVIPGHQVVGRVADVGSETMGFKVGDRAAVAWIFGACGECEFCLTGRENLCSGFVATGRDANGGYAEFMAVDERFAFHIPEGLSDWEVAPLLCAGAIGFRSLRLAQIQDGDVLGLAGFGASGHLVLKTARVLYPASKFLVFARSIEEQQFAMELGCDWAGDFTAQPPLPADAIIDTTPAWTPVVASMRALKPGGRLIINAIRKESYDQAILTNMSYHDHLWMEKEIKSVANITRADVEEFLKIAATNAIKAGIEKYQFLKANEALVALKRKHVRGAKVLVVQAAEE